MSKHNQLLMIGCVMAALAGCGGGGGSDKPAAPTGTAPIAVTAPPAPTASLSADSGTAPVGGTTTLTWSSANATSCTASGSWRGTKATTGSEAVTTSVAGEANYVLTCSGAGGNANATATVSVASQFMYVVSEPTATVAAYDVGASTPTVIPGSPFATGNGPRALAVHPSKAFVYVTNYGADSLSGYAIDAAAGTLSPLVGSPFATGTMPTGIAMAPSGAFAYVSTQNSGLLAYTVDTTTGALTGVGTSVVGSRSVTVHPSGNFVYASDNLTPGVYGYAIDTTTGTLSSLPGSPFLAGNSPARVTMHPSGQFAYAANLSANTITPYTINSTTGALTALASGPVSAGPYVASVVIEPSGRFAYAPAIGGPTSVGNLSAYAIDSTTGALTPLAASPYLPSTFPLTAAIDSSGELLYVLMAEAVREVRAFRIGSTGALTEVTSARFTVDNGSLAIAIAH